MENTQPYEVAPASPVIDETLAEEAVEFGVAPVESEPEEEIEIAQ